MRTEKELEQEVIEHVRDRKCIADPELLEFYSTLRLGDGGLPVSCAKCGHLLRREETLFPFWTTTPHDSWCDYICKACHDKLGNGIIIQKKGHK